MKETIETKKAASVNEAIEIINRLNYRNDTFEYHGYTREDNADIKYRHFDGYKENGELDGFSLIEIVVNGKLEVIRFFNHFRNITVDIKLGDFNLDYSRYDEVIDADAKIESNAEVESNGNDAEAKTKMTTIEMKIAKNGNIIVKTDDGIETSRKFADAVAALADTTFIGKPDVEIIVDRNDDSHICDIYKGGFDFNQSSYIFTDNNGNEYSFWDSHLALKQFARGIFGEAITVKPAVNEANPDDYAVTEDALEVAVNAEIQAANNAKINDLKWEIRYAEGSINDLDQNHIAHAPNDQSLQERRTELVNELAVLNSQLADLLPAEIQNANNEIHSCFYKQDDNDNLIQISYEQAQAEADEALAKFCGLSPEQYNEIKNEDSQVEPDNTELSDTEPATEPEVDPIITERQDARNEYYELNHVRNLIEKDVDRIERLRGRCKVGSPKYKAYNQLLADVDPIIRAFGDKFIAAQDRYNQSLTLRTDEERAATQKAIDEHNADLDARGIKYFATVYYYPNGVEGEDMENFFKDCQTLKEATDFVSQENIDGVYVGGIYDAGWEITDRNGNIVADHTTGIKEEQPMTIEIPAEGTHEFTIGDDTVCFFNGKFHSVFSAKYHMAIVRDLVGCFSYCIYNDGDTEVFNVREHAVSYDNFMETLHQRGNREKLLALRKEYIITDRLSKNNSSMWYVNGKRSSQVKVWNLLQSYGLTLAEFLTENEAYINGCIVASCKQIAIKDQSDFYADKINRESKSIDDYTTDRDAVFNLLPEVDDLNDVEIDDTPTNKPVDNRSLIRKWNEIIFSPEFKHETAKMVFTRQGSKHQLKIVWSYIFIEFDDVKGKFKFYLGTLLLAKYDTPAQVDKVIALIQAAIARGDKTFTFPTIDELIDPSPDTEPHYAMMTVKETIDDLNHSINWAKGVLATMQGDTYSDGWQDWTRSELETAITDWTSERDDLLTKPYFRNLFIKEQGMTLDAKNDTFISYADSEGNLRLNIFLTHDGQEQAVSITTETEILAYAHSASTPTFNHQQKKSIRDSLNRAKQIALENIRVARRNHNKKAEDYERELYDICNQALKEVA